MSRFWMVGLIVVSLIGCAASPAARINQSFDAEWRFSRGDIEGAQEPALNDLSWQAVNVPHDWSIEGPFDEKAATTGSGAFLPSGIGWYRKHFALPADAKSKRVVIDFDGVMANSDVWINGHHLGKRPYGYSSFRYDLTGHVKFGAGETNVIAVRADNAQQPASRWYSGAGIYRHVRLAITDPVHVAHWGTYVTTPEARADRAVVHVQSTVMNESDHPRAVSLQIEVARADGSGKMTDKTPPQTIAAGESAVFDRDITVAKPALWNSGSDNAAMYQAVVQVKAEEKIVDTDTVAFGIRHFEFQPETGFWLNGKNFKLKGVCLHHEGGAFGAAVPLAVWERRLSALRVVGANAIRTAHNPPAPEFLDLCDRMGFLVMDETFDCWTVAKNPFDYHLYFRDWFKTDARDMVLRDRNHPSVILYSAGNEIHDTPKPDLAKPILEALVKVMHEADPTRPVTQALFRPNVSHDYDNGLADLLDVVGQNYRENEILAAHVQKPSRKIVGTENGHDRKVWLPMRDNPPYSGQFLWTGIDYLGESRRWPTVTAGSGLLDRTGTAKSRAYERQSWWADAPMVRIARRNQPSARTPDDPGFAPLTRTQSQFCDWTPRNLDAHQESVEVYSNCDSVELMLNGKSLGSKDKPRDDSPRVWAVDFAPGAIKAIARNGDKIVATDELRTAGKAAKILLTVDRQKISPSWDDVSFVQATVVDDKGVPIPNADHLITFKTTGPGMIAAVDNADNSSHESFRGNQRKAHQGVCFAMIKASKPTGQIKVEATADGIAGGAVMIQTTAIAK